MHNQVRSGGQRGSSGGGKRRAQGQANVAIGETSRAENSHSAMDGMILISTSWVKVLFDTGVTHSFIYEDFVNILRL